MLFKESKAVKFIGNLALWALLVVVPLTTGAQANRKDGAQKVLDCVENAVPSKARRAAVSVADVGSCVNQVD